MTLKGRALLVAGMWKVGVLFQCVRFLPCWQTAHPFTKFTIQVFIPGHQKLQAIWHVVSSLPGCPAIGESWYRRTMSVLSWWCGGRTILPCADYYVIHVRPSILLFFVRKYFVFHFWISGRNICWTCMTLHCISCHSASRVMMSCANIFLERSVRFWLSSSPLSAFGGHDNMSGAAWSLPGICLIVRL